MEHRVSWLINRKWFLSRLISLLANGMKSKTNVSPRQTMTQIVEIKVLVSSSLNQYSIQDERAIVFPSLSGSCRSMLTGAILGLVEW